jgi:AcrR family transcriptional regulator
MECARKNMRYPVEETAAKHERIVKKASRLFRERGFENVSVAEVLKAADLTHGAFYAHFDSKEKLSELATVSVQSTCLCSRVIGHVVLDQFHLSG